MNRCTWLFGVSVGVALALMGCTESSGGTILCSDATPCGEGQYCDYADDLCGAGETVGTCWEIENTECDQPITVCTCDGAVQACYGAEGADQTDALNCEAPTGTFACDVFFCDPATEYCASEFSGDSCSTYFSCMPIPAACAMAPSCECLEEIDYTFGCTGEPATGFSAQLPGGHGPGCP